MAMFSYKVIHATPQPYGPIGLTQSPYLEIRAFRSLLDLVGTCSDSLGSQLGGGRKKFR